MLEKLAVQEKLAFIARKSSIDTSKPSGYSGGMDTIHTRIKNARLDKKLSMEKLAELIGLRSWQTIQQWENGGTAPARKRLDKVAEILGKTPEFLLNGTEPVQLDGEHSPVMMIDAKASAGKGSIVFLNDDTKTLMFRKDFLSQNGAKPDDVIAFPVTGKSMVDVHIIDKSVVIANRRKKEPVNKRIYVLWIDGELFVKQLVQKDGLWFARSHNKEHAEDYPDIQIDIDDRIVGRVFWCGFSI